MVSPGGEEQCVPMEQAHQVERRIDLMRGVEHKLGQPFAARRPRGFRTGCHTKSPGERRPHGIHVELLAFDGRRRNDVLQKGIELLAGLDIVADRPGTAEQGSLENMALAQRGRQFIVAPCEMGPRRLLPDPRRRVCKRHEPNISAIRLIR